MMLLLTHRFQQIQGRLSPCNIISLGFFRDAREQKVCLSLRNTLCEKRAKASPKRLRRDSAVKHLVL